LQIILGLAIVVTLQREPGSTVYPAILEEVHRLSGAAAKGIDLLLGSR